MSGETLDLDVYSDYKHDHGHGLRWSHRLTQRPRQDTEWELGAALATNEWPLSLDWTSLSGTWRRQVRDLYLTGGLRWIHRQADADRPEATETYRFALGLDWLGLRGPGGQLALALRLEQDFEDPEDRSIRLSLSWQATGARRLRDFKPGAIEFRDWQDWRLSEAVDED